MDRAQQITELHAEYVRLTGFKISLPGREWCWFEWLKRDLTAADLRLLVADTRTKIARGELTSASLQYRNLIGQVDYAEEKIAELRARRRAPSPITGDKGSLLRQTGRDVTPRPQNPDARPAGEIVAKLTTDPEAAARALAEFRAMRDRL
jgi:hypothetical protein